MNIDSIRNGYVLDHIKAGKAMEIYDYLSLDKLDCTVAIIKNVKSNKMGRKDIIKIDETIDINTDILGFIAPDITINKIKDDIIIEKGRPPLPKRMKNIINCKNPRCITTTEPGLDQVFVLTDEEGRKYSCIYCDSERGER
ncbi:MAG: aspartate carbamoyltransferase regulatory subunit [Christensenellales bacterium]|jgi:aspartate carbamoyltransferase regulatory subunit